MPLDLDKLEKKLDQALEKETAENLKKWLRSKREDPGPAQKAITISLNPVKVRLTGTGQIVQPEYLRNQAIGLGQHGEYKNKIFTPKIPDYNGP